MRTTGILIVMFFTGMVLRAGGNNLKFVNTDDQMYICENFRVGLNKTVCKLVTGEKVKVNNKEIISYRKDGKEFAFLPVYNEQTRTSKTIAMELVTNKGAFKLYKYSYYNGLQRTMQDMYYVYYDDNFIATINHNNISSFQKIFKYTINNSQA